MESKGIALITGASRGIGAATAIELARDGYDIWLNYRTNHDAAGAVAKAIEDCGGVCTLLAFDVSNGEQTSAVLEPLLKDKSPDVLVNNAGIADDTMLFWMSPEQWSGVLSVHLDGFFNVTRLLIASMIRKRRGRIINIASTSGQTGMPGQVNYSAAKAGLIGATKALAKEIAQRGILVNAVSPGFIETEMTEELPTEQVLSMIPLGRFGKADEVAKVVTFLCSDAATYITGQVINVNGGVFM